MNLINMMEQEEYKEMFNYITNQYNINKEDIKDILLSKAKNIKILLVQNTIIAIKPSDIKNEWFDLLYNLAINRAQLFIYADEFNDMFDYILKAYNVTKNEISNITKTNSNNYRFHLKNTTEVIIPKEKLKKEWKNLLSNLTTKGNALAEQKNNSDIEKIFIEAFKILEEEKEFSKDNITIKYKKQKKKTTLTYSFMSLNKTFECSNKELASMGSNNKEKIEGLVNFLKKKLEKFIETDIKDYIEKELEQKRSSILIVKRKTINASIKKEFTKLLGKDYSIEFKKGILKVSLEKVKLVSNVNVEDLIKSLKVEINQEYSREQNDFIYTILNEDNLKKEIENISITAAQKIYDGEFYIEGYKNKHVESKILSDQKTLIKKGYQLFTSINDNDILTPYYYVLLKDDKKIYVNTLISYTYIETNNSFFDILENNLQIKPVPVKYISKYEKIINDLSKAKVTNCVEFANKKLNEFSYEIIFESGKGLLFGKTKVNIVLPKIKTDLMIDINMPYFDDSITEWKKALTKELKRIEKQIKEEEIKYIDKLYLNDKSKIYGYILPRAIIEFITKNQKYITANAVIQYLRGNTVQLNTYIIDTNEEYNGAFNIYSKEEIDDMIELLIRNYFIKRRVYSGTYGDFFTLSVETKGANVYLKKDIKLSDIKKKIKNNESITDDEALIFFESIKNKEANEMKDFVDLLYLFNNKGFIGFYRDEYIEFIKKAPEEFFNFLKMKKSLEEEKWIKSIYIKILSK